MRTLIILLLFFVTTESYSQLPFVKGQKVVAGTQYTYNGNTYTALKNQTTGTTAPKDGTYWDCLDCPVPLTIDDVQSSLDSTKAELATIKSQYADLLSQIQSLQKAIVESTLTIQSIGDGIPLITVEGNVIKIKTFKVNGKKLRTSETNETVTLEQQ
jgi:hypothetical protein